MHIPLPSFFKNDPEPINFFGSHQAGSPQPKPKKRANGQWWTLPPAFRSAFGQPIAEGKKLAAATAAIATQFALWIPRRISMALIWALTLNAPIFLYITTTDWYAQLSDGIHWKHHDGATTSAVKDGLASLTPSHTIAPPLPVPLPYSTALIASDLPAKPTPLKKPLVAASSSTQAKPTPVIPDVRTRTAYSPSTLVHATRQEDATYFTAPIKIDGALFVAPAVAVELPNGTPGHSVAGKSGRSTGTSSLSPLGTPQ